MVEDKYCPTCGREIKTDFRTRQDILNDINRTLKLELWTINGKRKELIKLEEAIKNYAVAEEKGK